MSYSVCNNQINVGRTMPIKLRNIIERPTVGEYAFNKLAELISTNFNRKKSNKQNKVEPKTTFVIKQSRNINTRAASVKQPSLGRPKSIQNNDNVYFTQFFEYFAGGKDTEQVFKPYRQQQQYTSKPISIQSSTKQRRKAATVNKKSHSEKQSKIKNTKSIFGQWQIEQQNANFSILLKSNNE